MPCFHPKDPRIRSVFDRLVVDRACETDFEIAKQISRFKQVRETRERQDLYIGMDRRIGKSVLFAKKPIRKKGNGFIL